VLASPTAFPEATFSTDGLIFPATAIGAVSAPLSVTLTNPGTATLSVKSFIFSGTDASEFEIYGKTCSTSLAAGASCVLQIAFRPTEAGRASASLIATDNASNSPQAVVLSGSTLNSTATLSPASLTFPATAIGAVSTPQTVTFTNPSSTVLAVKSFTFSGVGADNFEIFAKTCSTTLAAGASCALQIAFKPTTAGVSTASLLATDVAANSPQTVVLSGATSVLAQLSPNSLTFAPTAVGAISAIQTVTFTNPSTVALSVKSFTFSGTNAGEFEIYGKTCSTSLAAGASCTLEIAFKPTTMGSASASLMATDDASNSPQAIALYWSVAN
jgi:Abnormal spindle-like microcephaly-assoc'd, ASPM-SPD-2-Hydin